MLLQFLLLTPLSQAQLAAAAAVAVAVAAVAVLAVAVAAAVAASLPLCVRLLVLEDASRRVILIFYYN